MALSEEGLFYVLNGQNLEIKHTLPATAACDVSVVGNYVAIAGSELQLFDVKQNRVSDSFKRKNTFQAVFTIKSTLLCGCDDGSFYLFNIKNGKMN